MTAPSAAVLAVDLGKTSCRLRLTRGEAVLVERSGHGAPGLAERDGAASSRRAILDVLEQVDPEARNAVTHVGVGAAGAEAAKTAAQDLATELRRVLTAPVAVLTDALAAHAGAFSGGPGSVLIAGTGAVLFAVEDSGRLRRVDGWGPWLGDEGGGCWIGQHGLQAVLRARDGRGPRTALEADANRLAGSIDALPNWVSAAGTPARQLGSFAPVVLARATEGDPVAVRVVDEAVRLLVDVSVAAVGERGSVCAIGGIVQDPYLSTRLTRALSESGIVRVPPLGDSLDGAALVATVATLPYEERIIRA